MIISYIILDRKGCSQKYGDTTGFYGAAKLFADFNMIVQNDNGGGPSRQYLRWRIYPLRAFGSTNLPSILAFWNLFWERPSISDLKFDSGISSVPFSLKASWAFSSFNSASYEKWGTRNVSGHEDHEEVDSGVVRGKDKAAMMNLPQTKNQKIKKNAFGATAPPFIDYLKEILRCYPDGGQMLKELIQNADDAGASKTVFIHDERRYGTDSVWSPAMGKYQGISIDISVASANLHLSRFSSTCSLLSLQITMSSANIIVQGDSCLTSSDNWSITIANRKGLRADP
ncbi:hypothetical protein QTP86_008784 [Hemibagrus guttatus]|nr:hypothetical protein QTP86_008784 [Hemibagrus guttatus]